MYACVCIYIYIYTSRCLRRGHANLLCIVPILTDYPRRESQLFMEDTHEMYH